MAIFVFHISSGCDVGIVNVIKGVNIYQIVSGAS